MEEAVGQGDGQHRVVGEPAERVEERELGRLDGPGLVDRADDVPGDGTEHREFSLFPTVNAFGASSAGSPTWIIFTKVRSRGSTIKRKPDVLVHVGWR